MRTIELRLDGFDGFEKLLGKNGKVVRFIKTDIKKANKKAATKVVRHLKYKSVPKMKKNAQLTVAIKGHTKVLQDTRHILDDVTVNALDWNHTWIGIPKDDPLRYGIAVTVHDGRVIRVTPKMRMMFLALHLVSIGARDPSTLTGRAFQLWHLGENDMWYPLRRTTTSIKIPPRPFFDEAFNDPSLKEQIRTLWTGAVESAIKRAVESAAKRAAKKAAKG